MRISRKKFRTFFEIFVSRPGPMYIKTRIFSNIIFICFLITKNEKKYEASYFISFMVLSLVIYTYDVIKKLFSFSMEA